jgi:hypothetical protein
MFNIGQNQAARVGYVAGTIPNAVTHGEWIAVTGFRTVSFLAQIGALANDLVLQAMQNSAATSVGAATVASATGTFTATTDNNRLGQISFQVEDLTAGNQYVALRFTPGGAVSFASALALLGVPYSEPPLNGSAQGVAFNVNL